MPGLLKPGKYFMQGNIAIAEAALIAGCRFYAGYPITPSNEIAEWMSRRLPEVGGVFIQMEDEIGSIVAVLGASAAGVKAMTATSGPGFSLMMESIGLASMMEIPSVIVNIMRAGPSTGIPTLVGQGDIMQAKWGSHGDYEIVAYLPNSVQEAFDFTIKAFNTAERYRILTMVLADQVIGHMMGKLVVPDYSEIEIVEREKPTVPPDQYLVADSRYLVPPMAIAGTGYRVNYDSLTHDDRGYPSVDKEISFRLVQRLVRKVRENERKIAEWEEYETDDAELLMVAYGCTSRSVKEVVKKLRKEGFRIGLFRPKTAWPFPWWRLRELSEKVNKIIVVEINMGQMVHVVREYAAKDIDIMHVPYAPGYMPDPGYIEGIVRKVYGA
ncbi:MAG: 2-oxoacid:acceptor oxidoreductase subunit alpha [Sulfolobales archaeon]|jgi:2-oxoglutarate ferredoxin oxidoreductase subunit alpha